MSDDSKPYLEYLDKEMTIMGVLSAFAVAVPGLVITQVAGAEKSSLTDVWKLHHDPLIIGSGSLLLSALFFYRQRSLLAYYYGQICLTLSPYREAGSTSELLREVDSWPSWLHYHWAFGFLILGFFEIGVAVGGSVVPGLDTACRFWTLYVPIGITLVVSVLQAVVLSRYPFSDKPWMEVLRYFHIRK